MESALNAADGHWPRLLMELGGLRPEQLQNRHQSCPGARVAGRPSMTTDTELRILELRDSVAWAAGQSYERRRIGEMLRIRATLLEQMPGPTPRGVVRELRRMAHEIDREPG